VLGPATSAPWRQVDLAAHTLTARRNGAFVAEGRGANALGDPRIALAWVANELTRYGEHLRAGDVVTTGTCVVPFALARGDRIQVDFGAIGKVGLAIA
jgi:2-keto-4-pentenoate hydratase